jgi:hypothetical protein
MSRKEPLQVGLLGCRSSTPAAHRLALGMFGMADVPAMSKGSDVS